MKSTTFFAFFLLCAIFTSHLPSATADVILDIEGNPLQNGGSYRILSLNRALGGIRPAATGNERCPLTVVQSSNELDRGVETILTSPYFIGFITEGLPLSIRFGPFPIITLCAGIPTKWSVAEDGAVKIGEKEKDAVDGWFNIEKASSDDEYNDYKLVFCPRQEDEDDNSKCENVGIDIDDDGMRRLVVSKNEKSLVVQFQKVESQHSRS